MNKKFDCVEMKHKAARIIQKKLSKMSREEELEYWKAQSVKLEKRRKRLINQQKENG